jgi:SAM-dependent methyltransferase
MTARDMSRTAAISLVTLVASTAVLAGQSGVVRLGGDGLLGPEADSRRRVSPAYGYEGTPHAVVPAMVALADVGASDVAYEPGCGDARVLLAAVKAGAARGFGIDIDPNLAEVAFARARAAGFEDRIDIYWGNALDLDMSQATVVFLFMGEGFNRVIRPLLWAQLPVGARVVSNDYGMGDWPPERTVRVDTPGRTYTLYRWTITPNLKGSGQRIAPGAEAYTQAVMVTRP